MIWGSSIYKFRVPANAEEQQGDLKEIAIDVTLSAPPFPDPGDVLESAFADMFEYLGDKEKLKILDFGAAKLRNTVYLLKKGYQVQAVEFEKLLNEPGQAFEMREKAKKFKDKFGEPVFPDAFVNSKQRFDLVLLINVLSIMPVPSERLLVLQYCRGRLKEGGHLFYYSMHGDKYYKANCTDEVRIGDGYYMNKGKHKSFYREFEDYEADFMFLSCGFELAHKIPIKNNHARLYRKQSSNLIEGMIPLSQIEKLTELGKNIPDPQTVPPRIVPREKNIQPVIPNPEDLSLENLWLKKLKQIPPGKSGAADFHGLATLMLRRVFEPQLTNFKFEEREDQAGKRLVEITASNRDDRGFFKWLRDSTTIISSRRPFIFMEARNYEYVDDKEEVSNFAKKLTELDFEFGFMIYRGTNRSQLLKDCRSFAHEDKYVLPLVESDLVRLFKMFQANADQEIMNFLDDRFQELILKGRRPATKDKDQALISKPKKRQPVIFVSYSHKDEPQRERLELHLRVLQSEVEVWSDKEIGAGANWQQEIDQAMARATVGVLLVTANFLTSNFIKIKEVPILLQRSQTDGLRVVPILAKHCAWQQVDWLKAMEVRPKNAEPVWRSRGAHVDKELAKITNEVAKYL